MAKSTAKASPMSPTISLPTQSDRDTGVMLLFLSLVSYYAVPVLAYEFGFRHGDTSVISTPVGLVLMLSGLAMLFLARKKIHVEPGQVRIKDGFLARPLHLRYESTPTIKLSVYEEERAGRVDQVWTVHLIDEGRQYLVDRRVGQHIAVRALAERLAKATQGSLIESCEGRNVTFELSELDLPFMARVEKHPFLMGSPVDEPGEKVVEYSHGADGIEVSWTFFRSGMLLEVILVAAMLLGAAFIPLPSWMSSDGVNLYHIARATGDYRYFLAVSAFAVVSMVALAGYRNRIRLDATAAVSQSTVWGVPVRSFRIPLEELEHVGISVTSRGTYLLLISDKQIVRELLPSTHIARWLAWEMRQYLASQSGTNPAAVTPLPAATPTADALPTTEALPTAEATLASDSEPVSS